MRGCSQRESLPCRSGRSASRSSKSAVSRAIPFFSGAAIKAGLEKPAPTTAMFWRFSEETPSFRRPIERRAKFKVRIRRLPAAAPTPQRKWSKSAADRAGGNGLEACRDRLAALEWIQLIACRQEEELRAAGVADEPRQGGRGHVSNTARDDDPRIRAAVAKTACGIAANRNGAGSDAGQAAERGTFAWRKA